MAEIFLARGEGVAGVERYCVLKRILGERAGDVQFVRMFLDEARLAAQLQHPNIAQVYDIGKLGDSYFFTMEYVHGETVRTLLHRALGLRRKLPIGCVLTIAAGTAAGLHHAHARLGFDGRALGIVHRDVSPSNLMVSYEGGVKVVDFGVAKAADRTQETKSGTVKGKISYLSPEQCRGKRVDRRSDLFSLGICFWEMLTTERLFKRASDFENMNAIVTEATPPPSSRRPDVPPELDELVLRLLAKSPEERFQTADEVVDAIEGVAARTSTILSASALGRFVRELFGQRPEPWLELEGQQEQGEAVTVTSEPIPRELALGASDAVNQQLASVVDLSPPPSITESLELEPVPLDAPTARLGKLPSLDLPLTAPPPTQPRITPLATAAVSPASLPPPPVPPASLPPPPARTTAPAYSASPPSSAVPTQSLSAYSVSPPPALDSFPSSSEQLAIPAVAAVPGPRSGPHAAVPGPRSGPHAAVPGPRSGPHAAVPGPRSEQHAIPPGPYSGSMVVSSVPHSGPHAVSPGSPSGSFVAPLGPHAGAFSGPSGAHEASSGSQSSMRVAASYSTPEHRRAAWPLYAVIGSAALVGSIAVVIMMRAGSEAVVVDAANTAKPPPPVVTPLEPLPRAPIPKPSVSDAKGTSEVAAAGSATGPAVAAGPAAAPDAGNAAMPGPRVAAAAPNSSDTGPAVPPPVQTGSTQDPGAAPGLSRTVEPPARPSVPPRRSPASPAVSASSRSMELSAKAPGQAPARQPETPDKRDLQGDEIGRLFAAEHYDKVVPLCSAGPVSAEHARFCFLAACHTGNGAKARQLLTAVPASRRDQLILNCKQLGVDITATARKKPDKPADKPTDKPADKPVEDCEADPMACQH